MIRGEVSYCVPTDSKMWKLSEKSTNKSVLCCAIKEHVPAVQMVKTTCTESKKKNMTSRDTEAPIGRNRACVESIVWMPEKEKKKKHKTMLQITLR